MKKKYNDVETYLPFSLTMMPERITLHRFVSTFLT